MRVSLARTKGYVSKLPTSSFQKIILAERDEIELSDLLSKLETWELLLSQEINIGGAGRSSTAPETPVGGSRHE